MNRQMLIAADGRAESLAALRLARALSETQGVEGGVVTVLQPTAPWTYDPMTGAAAVYWDTLDVQKDAQREAVRAQLAAVGGAAAGWPLEAVVGPCALTLARRAEERGAGLIVMGRGRHEWSDRLLGRETVLDVLRVAHLPVLAVPADHAGLPRKALVATDFSEQSLDAARVAVGLLAPEAEVHVVNVSWTPAVEVAWAAPDSWADTYETGARSRLEEIARELAGPGRVVHTHLLKGDLADVLLAFAERERVELIATGSHGYGFFSRAILGSLSTRMVRSAHCAVLVSPPRTPSAALHFEEAGAEHPLAAGSVR
jgi:nucleotide-binding universal stress UspA family protein